MTTTTNDVDALAQEIRRVDGNHDLGAGALAEALTPFIARRGVLNMRDLTTLAMVAECAQQNRRVRFLASNSGNVVEGVARSIGDEQGNFLREDEDVRDGFLRISSTMEWFLPVRDVMQMLRDGSFGWDR